MSNDKRQHRPKSAATVKLAFVDEDQQPDQEEKVVQEADTKTKRDKSKKRNGTKKHSSQAKKPDEIKMKAHFSLNNITVEVCLDDSIISWRTLWTTCKMNFSTKSDKLSAKKLQDDGNLNSVDLKQVHAILPKYELKSSSTATLLYPIENSAKSTNSKDIDLSSNDKSLVGFELHSVIKNIYGGDLKATVVTFQSDSPEQIHEWFHIIEKIMRKLKPTRDLLVLCNTDAGAKDGATVYKNQVHTILERAFFNIHYREISRSTSIEPILENLGEAFERLHGVVIIGGDGTVTKVINGILFHLSTANQIELNRENDLPKLHIPICIIPCGTTNILCNTIYGETDILRPVLHLLIDERINIDMSAIFDENDHFITANFTAAAGYGALALDYFSQYSNLIPRKIIRKSFYKASLKKNLRAMKMEIRYIPSPQANLSDYRCSHNCDRCFTNIEVTDNDEVQDFDSKHIRKDDQRVKPSLPSKKNAFNRHSSKLILKDNRSEVSHFETLTGVFLLAAIYTNANLWAFAPQGLSKFAHLADGNLHLVLVASVKHKQFIRYLKRHSGFKNQLDFPFVKFIKAQEVEIELITDDDSKPRDSMTSAVQSSQSELSSLEESDDDEPRGNSQSKNSKSSYSGQLPPRPIDSASKSRSKKHREDSNNESEDDIKNTSWSGSLRKRKNSFSGKTSSSNGTLRPGRSLLNILGNSSSTTTAEKTSSKGQNGNRRRSSFNIDNQNVNNENATSQLNSNSTPCDWNIDFTPHKSKLIRMKCFHRFLPVFGAGVLASSELRNVYYQCF